MTEQTEQTTAQPDAVPARIELEAFIEAVTRGVARALAAAEDEVSGYLQLDGRIGSTTGTLPPVLGRPPIIVGFVVPPPGPTYPGDPRDSKIPNLG